MLYLDIETLDFFQDPPIARLPRPVQLRAMRFGLATLYNDQAIPSAAWSQWWPADRHYPLGRVVWSDGPEEPGDLADLWRFLMNQTIVGWNIFDFDLPFLMLHVNAEADYPGDPWLDPMQIIDLMGILKHASKGSAGTSSRTSAPSIWVGVRLGMDRRQRNGCAAAILTWCDVPPPIAGRMCSW